MFTNTKFLRVFTVLIVALLLLAACGPGATPETEIIEVEKEVVVEVEVEVTRIVEGEVVTEVIVVTATPASEEAAPEETVYGPDYPMIINWVRQSDPPTSDPAIGASVSGGIEIEHNVYDTLMRYDGETDKIIPGLAVSYEANADATEFIFQLREGVKFHNGDEFNANEVKFVWERMLAGGAMPASYWDPVEDMEVIDEYTVKMTMKFPYAPWPSVTAGSRGMYIGPSQASVEEHATADDPWAFEYFQDHENGTGPYIMTNWERDVKIEFEKFDDYWLGWEGKHADKHVFYIIKDDNTIRLMLEKGDIDLFTPNNPQQAVEMQKNPDIVVRVTPSYMAFAMYLNVNKFPTDNKLVRQALIYTYDFEASLDDVYEGMGGLGGVSYFPETMWPIVTDLEPRYTYDLEKAADLMVEAGWEEKDGKWVDASGEEFPVLTLQIMDLEVRRQMTELWMNGLRKLGITVEPQYVTWPVNAADMGKPPDEKPHQLSGMSNWPAFIDPSEFVKYLTTKEATGGFNWAGYQNPVLDNLAAEALATSVESERIELYTEMLRIIQDDAPVFITTQVDMIQAYRPWVKDYLVNPGLQHVQIFYPTYIEGRPPEFDHLD